MANYLIVEDTPEYLLIKDVGPWHHYRTVTNDAETVVEQLAGRLTGRPLFCIDSCGETDRILVKDGKFAGFSPEKPPGHQS